MSESNARRFSDPHELKTSIPEGLTIRGELSGSESVELLGTLEGPLTTEGFCHIHERGSLRGRLSATDVIVEGELEGDIFARGKVELGAGARVKAEIRAQAIAIADGCYFDGQIHMEGGEERVRFQEKRRGR
jgi:cytoskeletal protein CcmA (bactofilin family)